MSDYPHFGAMLDGYFHQDFVAEHGSPEDAARAFVRESPVEDCRAAAEEILAFMALAETETRQEWLRRLRPIGGAWRPRSLESVRKVAAVLESGKV